MYNKCCNAPKTPTYAYGCDQCTAQVLRTNGLQDDVCWSYYGPMPDCCCENCLRQMELLWRRRKYVNSCREPCTCVPRCGAPTQFPSPPPCNVPLPSSPSCNIPPPECFESRTGCDIDVKFCGNHCVTPCGRMVPCVLPNRCCCNCRRNECGTQLISRETKSCGSLKLSCVTETTTSTSTENLPRKNAKKEIEKKTSNEMKIPEKEPRKGTPIKKPLNDRAHSSESPITLKNTKSVPPSTAKSSKNVSPLASKSPKSFPPSTSKGSKSSSLPTTKTPKNSSLSTTKSPKNVPPKSNITKSVSPVKSTNIKRDLASRSVSPGCVPSRQFKKKNTPECLETSFTESLQYTPYDGADSSSTLDDSSCESVMKCTCDFEKPIEIDKSRCLCVATHEESDESDSSSNSHKSDDSGVKENCVCDKINKNVVANDDCRRRFYVCNQNLQYAPRYNGTTCSNVHRGFHCLYVTTSRCQRKFLLTPLWFQPRYHFINVSSLSYHTKNDNPSMRVQTTSVDDGGDTKAYRRKHRKKRKTSLITEIEDRSTAYDLVDKTECRCCGTLTENEGTRPASKPSNPLPINNDNGEIVIKVHENDTTTTKRNRKKSTKNHRRSSGPCKIISIKSKVTDDNVDNKNAGMVSRKTKSLVVEILSTVSIRPVANSDNKETINNSYDVKSCDPRCDSLKKDTRKVSLGKISSSENYGASSDAALDDSATDVTTSYDCECTITLKHSDSCEKLPFDEDTNTIASQQLPLDNSTKASSSSIDKSHKITRNSDGTGLDTRPSDTNENSLVCTCSLDLNTAGGSDEKLSQVFNSFIDNVCSFGKLSRSSSSDESCHCNDAIRKPPSFCELVVEFNVSPTTDDRNNEIPNECITKDYDINLDNTCNCNENVNSTTRKSDVGLANCKQCEKRMGMLGCFLKMFASKEKKKKQRFQYSNNSSACSTNNCGCS